MIQGKRILVTGGAGFLGRNVCYELRFRKPAEIIVPRSREFDLRLSADVEALFVRERPEVVIHLAATVGGIGLNMARPADLCGDNLAMGVNLIQAAQRFGVEKFVLVATACSYPLDAPLPLKEASLHDGYPEPTNAPYGLAKRMLVVMLDAYRRQYGLNGISLIPANLYGPGDKSDEGSSHVIPAIIRKVSEAKAHLDDTCDSWALKLWGTGKASRDFLYVQDAARGIVEATESYDGAEPVNLGSGRETTIAQVAGLICKRLGYYGQIEWEYSRPDGQPRRLLDTTRAKAFGWEAQVDLEQGLANTIDWFCNRGCYASVG